MNVYFHTYLKPLWFRSASTEVGVQNAQPEQSVPASRGAVITYSWGSRKADL